jgi:hypothetical protein
MVPLAPLVGKPAKEVKKVTDFCFRIPKLVLLFSVLLEEWLTSPAA